MTDKIITILQLQNTLNKIKQILSDIITATSEDIELINNEISNINIRLDQLNVTPESIGAANIIHNHGSMNTIIFSATEPTTVNDGEIVMVYEE